MFYVIRLKFSMFLNNIPARIFFLNLPSFKRLFYLLQTYVIFDYMLNSYLYSSSKFIFTLETVFFYVSYEEGTLSGFSRHISCPSERNSTEDSLPDFPLTQLQ